MGSARDVSSQVRAGVLAPLSHSQALPPAGDLFCAPALPAPGSGLHLSLAVTLLCPWQAEQSAHKAWGRKA